MWVRGCYRSYLGITSFAHPQVGCKPGEEFPSVTDCVVVCSLQKLSLHARKPKVSTKNHQMYPQRELILKHPPQTETPVGKVESREWGCGLLQTKRCLWRWVWSVLGRRWSPGGSEVKASACNVGDPDSTPGLGRSLREGNGNPLQYSCLENPMDRGAW